MLSEANIIKEEYIGRFRSCSTYIDKLRRTEGCSTKGYLRKTEELYKTLKSTRLVEEELNEFYKISTGHSKDIPQFRGRFQRVAPDEEKSPPGKTNILPPNYVYMPLFG